jgi:hypothetical protein
MGKTDIKRDILFAPNGCYFPDAYCRGYHTHCAFVCFATTIALLHMADRSSGRTLAHGGQEHPSGQGPQLTNTLMLTHAHAHAVQETIGSMLRVRAHLRVGQGGVDGKTLILQKITRARRRGNY